jgi:ribulose-phosphate 3-epimerase
MDCHMMVTEPSRWVKDIAEAGGSSYTFHLEAAYDPLEVVRRIKAEKMRAAIAINPGTPTSEISNELGNAVDMILVMTVWPGYGGQKFMKECMPKVAELRARFPDLDIEVDGGVGPNTIDRCADAGANVLVAGTAIFHAESPKEVIQFLRQRCEEAQTRIQAEREQILFDPNCAIDDEEGEDLTELEGKRSRAMTPLSHPRAYIRNLALRKDSLSSFADMDIKDGKKIHKTGYGVPSPSVSRRPSENVPPEAAFNGAIGMTPMNPDHEDH